MNHLNTNYLQRIMLALLVLGILGGYTVSVVTMQHNVSMADSSMTTNLGANCAMLGTPQGNQTQDMNYCLSYHLGLIQNLSEISFQNSIQFILLTVIFSSLLALIFLSRVRLIWNRLKLRLKRFAEVPLNTFYKQLGFWLTLFEKRDPAYALQRT